MDDYLLEKKGMREAFITKNFESLVLPKIAEGEKVYSNFGYAHVLQNKLNDRMYLAAILKEKSPELKIYSILTHMADSEVLDNKKYCKNGFIKRYGKKIKLASICGTETSTELAGDTKKESVRGIEDLKNTTEMGEITIVPMKEVKQDLQIKLYYLDYVDGMNPDELIFDTNSKTIDYFQALIFIRGSEANDTYEMY